MYGQQQTGVPPVGGVPPQGMGMHQGQGPPQMHQGHPGQHTPPSQNPNSQPSGMPSPLYPWMRSQFGKCQGKWSTIPRNVLSGIFFLLLRRCLSVVRELNIGMPKNKYLIFWKKAIFTKIFV